MPRRGLSTHKDPQQCSVQQHTGCLGAQHQVPHRPAIQAVVVKRAQVTASGMDSKGEVLGRSQGPDGTSSGCGSLSH
jgi:hypothetical protein